VVRLEGVSNRRAAEGLWDVSYSCGLMSGPGWRTEGNTTASILLGLEVRLLHGGQPIGRVRDLLSAAVSRC